MLGVEHIKSAAWLRLGSSVCVLVCILMFFPKDAELDESAWSLPDYMVVRLFGRFLHVVV